MANEDDKEPDRVPQMGDVEMASLARRLRARADSVMYRDQPHQAADLKAAAAIIMNNASLLRRLAHLQGELRRTADATTDESTERHLRELLGAR